MSYALKRHTCLFIELVIISSNVSSFLINYCSMMTNDYGSISQSIQYDEGHHRQLLQESDEIKEYRLTQSESAPLLISPKKKHFPGVDNKSCCVDFSYYLNKFIILETISLITFLSLMLYSVNEDVITRNKPMIITVIVMLIISNMFTFFSLKFSYPFKFKALIGAVKALATSYLFTFSIVHPDILPIFFFYFFSTTASICITLL